MRVFEWQTRARRESKGRYWASCGGKAVTGPHHQPVSPSGEMETEHAR
jgi:hypothetical protein